MGEGCRALLGLVGLGLAVLAICALGGNVFAAISGPIAISGLEIGLLVAVALIAVFAIIVIARGDSGGGPSRGITVRW